MADVVDEVADSNDRCRSPYIGADAVIVAGDDLICWSCYSCVLMLLLLLLLMIKSEL